MGFIEKYIEGNFYKWIWFLGTLIGSLLPILARLFACLAFEINYFDIKDVLFAGLAMNLSNLSLIGSKRFKMKPIIALASGIFIFLLSMLIAIFLCAENKPPNNYQFILNIISLIFVAGAVFLSYTANNYVFKNSKS